MSTINFLIFAICVLFVAILIMWATYSHKLYKVIKELEDEQKTNKDLVAANRSLRRSVHDLEDTLEDLHNEYKEKFTDLGKLTVHKEQE